MIRIEHLTKSFRGRPAVDDVSLEIPAGTITGLLGPNGAGKSTLIGMMLGQMRPNHGEVFIRDVSVQRDRAKSLRGVGAVSEAPGFHEEFSGWDNLAFLASLSGVVSEAEIQTAVEFVGLGNRIRDRVRDYSRGMRLRLGLAQALVPQPEVILLDEPLEGLDPAGIRDARELILRVRTEWKTTVLFSSHLLAEVKRLCDAVAILNHGRMAFSGTCQRDGEKLEACYLAAVAKG
jgi:ABC-2 type transport system ATP-binding protein